MKREIKFRAYSSHNHKMYPVSNIEWDIDGRIWVTADDGKNGIELIDEEAHLMQYAGLHDKNGREIYEGDIVKYHMVRSYGDHYDPVTLGFIGTDWDVDADIIGKVSIWPSNGVMMTNVITDDPDMFCKEYPVPKRWHVTNDCEVIGNIFEDPELMEGKHEQK
ncbi:YopX family protein [Lacticaseibacillus paracasei]|uniref:YopX family protein n=1 Tax=Lacticaseibacillus paracasei TaxID=1597 RepID=UPI003CF8D1CD